MSIQRETVEQRKALPIATGVLDYFPDALLAVAEVSRIGNEQHHPGEPLHWDKSKSTDQADALMRHLLDRGTVDTDGVRHSAKVAWRALALLQTELDAEAAKPKTAAEVLAIMTESWGVGDGEVFDRLAERYIPEQAGDSITRAADRGLIHAVGTVENRGEWPPDTRVNGLLTCCGQSEHPVDCPQWR